MTSNDLLGLSLEEFERQKRICSEILLNATQQMKKERLHPALCVGLISLFNKAAKTSLMIVSENNRKFQEDNK